MGYSHTNAEALPRQQLHDDIIEGLLASQKVLPSKYLYDAEGSRLFEMICDVPEYYVTRAETALLVSVAPKLSERLPSRAALVEFGSGASAKTRLLLDALHDVRVYVPIDISESALSEASRSISEDYPTLRVIPLAADFTEHLHLPRAAADLAVIGFFPGSTIGNFNPSNAESFLRNAHAMLGAGSTFIIGVDVAKSAEILIPAYDDPQGVTAAFNKNLLVRLNREFGSDFDPTAFSHRAVWNSNESRIEMHLVSLCEQAVVVGGLTFKFSPGETIHTENSYKYQPETFERMAARAGWRVFDCWTSESPTFAIFGLSG